jgi:hypothetical protein
MQDYVLISVRGTYYHYCELPAATFDAFVAVPRPRDWPPEQKVSQTRRTVELIGAANIFAPRSSRTAMKFPRLTKLGRSVPMRCVSSDAMCNEGRVLFGFRFGRAFMSHDANLSDSIKEEPLHERTNQGGTVSFQRKSALAGVSFLSRPPRPASSQN